MNAAAPQPVPRLPGRPLPGRPLSGAPVSGATLPRFPLPGSRREARLRAVVDRLVAEPGRTACAEAGIRLQDAPGPLYRLLVLSTLVAVRVRAESGVGAARALHARGLSTPRALAQAGPPDVAGVLAGAGHSRWCAGLADALVRGADHVLRTWDGDLRLLRARAGGDPARVRALLCELPRVGPVASAVFCREAQAVWPELRPFFDPRALEGAARLGLPADPARLAALTRPDRLHVLACALVRVSRNPLLRGAGGPAGGGVPPLPAGGRAAVRGTVPTTWTPGEVRARDRQALRAVG